MSVRADRAGLADPARDFATGAPPRPRRPAPALRADAADLPRFLRATALLGDLDHLASAYAACDAAIRAGVPPADEHLSGDRLAGDRLAGAHLAELYSLRSSLARRRGDLAA